MDKRRANETRESHPGWRVLLGCSGLNPEEYQSREFLPALSEIDLISYSSWTAKDRRALGVKITSGHQVIGSCSSAWLLRGCSSEKKLMLEELCSELQVTQVIVRLQVCHLHQMCPSDLPVELYLDYPKGHREALFSPQRRGPALRWVWDPLWDPPLSPPPGVPGIVKIHGWHDLRWVRRYSIEQVNQAMRKVQAYANSQNRTLPVLLSYSQRREQFAQFKAALER